MYASSQPSTLGYASPGTPILRASTRLSAWMLLIVVLLALGLYANSLRNGYAFDDCAIVESNPSVQQLEWSRIWSENYWPSQEGPVDVLYRPLTIYTYLVNKALTPGQVWPYHAVNVALHAMVSLLATLLAWRLFRQQAIALIAGMLFAVHPIHTEVVANIVGRAELLAAFWSLVALLLYLPTEPLEGRALLENGAVAHRGFWHGWVVAACFLLALLSKETPAALLGAFAFLDYWQWSHAAGPRPTLARWAASRLVRYYLPLGLALGVYLAMRISAVGLMYDIHGVHPLVNPLVEATPAQRIFTPFLLLTRYLLLMAWPKVLSADYSAPSIMPTANPLDPMVLIGLLVVATGLMAVVSYWRRSPAVVATIALLASSYVLVANAVRIGTIFGERLFYWPSVFVCLLAAYGAVHVWGLLRARQVRPVLRWAVAGLAACGVMALSARTVLRNPDWADNISLALATGANNPASAKACEWAGQVLVCSTDNPWTVSVGEDLLHRAIKLYPTMGQAYWELAKHYARAGKPDLLLEYASEAALRNPGRLQMRQALQTMDFQLHRYPVDKYLPAAEARAARDPNNPCTHFALGLALRAAGRPADAEREVAKAVDLQAGFDEAGAELGILRLNRGDHEGAVNLLKTYVLRMRYNGEARFQLARALMGLDPAKYPGALAEADMNLTRAEELLRDNWVVRRLRAELIHKQTAAKAHSGPAAAAAPAALAHEGQP